MKSDHQGMIPLHRLEGFSDAVFAFAVTLLVVSLEVPKSADELFAAMHGFVAFGICFMFLVLIWIEHSRFFQRFPLNDGTTVALNMVLLFVVLLYVYPLKFLFSALTNAWLWGRGTDSIKSLDEFRALMVIYGLGFLALNLVLMGMRFNARRLARQRGISARDEVNLRAGIARNGCNGLVALTSVLIVVFTRDDGVWCGFIYALLGPIAWYFARRSRNQEAQAELTAA